MPRRSTLELRLTGLSAADGEIPLVQLAALAAHAQELALRTARALVGAAGPGRSHQSVEDAACLSMTGITTGSTVLKLAGPHREDTLPLGDEFVDLSDRVFESIGLSLDSLAQGRVPDTSGPALDSFRGLFRAAALNGGELETTTTVAGGKPRRACLNPADAGEIVESARSACQPEAVPRVVSGRLYMVDIRNGRFRIEDDLGTTIDLVVAGDPAAVAGLIGSRVEAEGTAEYDSDGRLLRVGSAVLAAATPIPSAEAFWKPRSLEELLEGSQPYDASESGIEGVDSEEIAAFLKAIGR